MGIGTRMWIRAGLKQSKPLIIIKNRLFNVGGQIMREYDISEDGIMVLCKACERYLDLLHGKPEESNSLASKERNNERKNERAIKKNIRIFKRTYGNHKCCRTGNDRKVNCTCDVGIIKSNKGTKGNVYLKQ